MVSIEILNIEVNIMSRIRFILIALLFLLNISAEAFRLSELNRTKRGEPNFLILIADDAGMDFGCYGNRYIKTPNIDELARIGIICEKTFLTSPQCSPSRISILSGQYPHTTRTEDLHTPLPDGVNFITTYLKQEGYFTGSNGKTHWGPNGDRQFDWYEKGRDTFELFLREAKGKPFFFWTGFFDPHRPYQKGTIGIPHTSDNVVVRDHLVNDERTRKDIALYYDEISRMDSVIGIYIEILKQEKLLKDTYIIFLSDNGAPFPREKGSLYDTGIQTPFIISGPGVPNGEVYDGLMSIIDLAPTILDLAGIKKPEDMPGMSFTPLLNGDFVISPEFVYSERNWHDCDEHMRSIRSDQYKLILNAYTEKPHGTAADLANSRSWFSLLEKKSEGELSEEQKLIFAVPRPSVELYDLSKDPKEYKNVAFDPDYRQTAEYLLVELQKWIQETDDFPPTYRTRRDHTDRITGIRYYFQNPELENDLPEKDTISVSEY
jgi:arylsulfatase A-like enzyme